MPNKVTAIAAAAVAAALWGGLALWWSEGKREEKVMRSAAGLLSAQANEKKARYPLAVLAHNAAMQPLNQKRLNQYIVAAVREKQLTGPSLDKAMGQLANLGWRDTPSLQNQILFHGSRGEIGLTLDNVDALLRREKLGDDVLAAMSMAETDPAFRKVLIERLKGGASWTSRFLQFSALLQRPDNVRARAITMRALVDANVPLSRMDIAPSLLHMVRAGDRAEAYAIWEKWRGAPARAAGGFDHDFRLTAQIPANEREVPVPFEWMLASGPGYRGYIDGSDVGASLSIRWDGRGVPYFVQRIFKAPQGDWGLRVSGLNLTPASIRDLRFLVACPTGQPVDMIVRIAEAKQGLLLVPEKRIDCAYPGLVIRGQPREAGLGPREWVINDISFERR